MRAYWTHPCAHCGKPCDKEAKHCRACMFALGTWRHVRIPQPSVPTHVRPNVLFELYCFMCGRGVGHRGVLVVTPQPPSRRPDPCRSCGGALFVREVITDRALVTIANPRKTESHARRVA